jgi:hypothetical protein
MLLFTMARARCPALALVAPLAATIPRCSRRINIRPRVSLFHTFDRLGVPTYQVQRRTLALAASSSDDGEADSATIIEEEAIIMDGAVLRVSSADETPTTPTKPEKIRKPQLKDELKEYRLLQSASLGKPPYSVFTNAAMLEIYQTLPTTKVELLHVKGIGPKKLEMFGDDILSMVSKYAAAGYGSDSSIGEEAPALARIPQPAKIDPATLTDEQRRAADLPLDSDQRSNVFITGAAGTGKSHVLKYIIQELRKNKSKFGVCAPTGVAAINVGGSTLHSFFGIGLGAGSLSTLIKKVTKNKEAKKRIDETDVLCIDECSMLSSDLLETLDAVVREVRQDGKFKEEPFGGMQIIAVGDFFQLPPIYRAAGMDREWRPFCFDSPVWSDLGLIDNKLELKEVLRQGGETKFIQFLNMVRIGEVTEKILQDFNAKCMISTAHPLPNDGIVPTRLYVLNKDVDAVNESRLAELEGKEVICKATDEWREKMPTGTLASVKKNVQSSIEKEMPDEVKLKVGAQVMLTRNKDLERNLVNGSRGVVEHFVMDAEGDQIPIVRFDCGVVEKVPKAEAVRYPDGGVGCLVRKQVPLKLAWALTVHKSQGTTLTRALLDVSSAFEFGQVYVALSRVRTLDGLWLERPARLQNVMVSPQVLDFYNII